jgi:CDP-glycerol glycerophosphotransferase (TagB/SpsB family)
MKVINEIGSDFNLLLRLHPFLEDLYPAQVEIIKSLTAIELSSFPSIYPILRRADYYLGDASSVGYDFVSLDKPLFFLERFEGEIYDCGLTLSKNDNYGKILKEFHDHKHLSGKRNELARKVFGIQKSFDSIKNKIKEALSHERASWVID